MKSVATAVNTFKLSGAKVPKSTIAIHIVTAYQNTFLICNKTPPFLVITECASLSMAIHPHQIIATIHNRGKCNIPLSDQYAPPFFDTHFPFFRTVDSIDSPRKETRLITSRFDLSAAEISEIYRSRRAISLQIPLNRKHPCVKLTVTSTFTVPTCPL